MCNLKTNFFFFFFFFFLLYHSGSLSGGPIAASWAVLRCMGQNGYLEVAKRLMEVADIMKEGVGQVEVGS